MEDLRQIIPQIIKREAKVIAASVIVGLVVTAGITTKAYSERISEGVSKSFIRFHVLPNSDSEEDQRLKLQVRDEVLSSLKSELDACETITETREMLTRSFDEIEDVAAGVIEREGYSYPVKVSLENIMFPTREYGDIVLPAGMYEALRVEIGEGKGKNWWCAVYPPLCYLDVTQGRVPEKTKEQLKNSMPENEYRFIVKSDDVSVKIKFKVVELWQEGKMVALSAFRR